KSGSEICCSVLASWAFLAGASKIAPHSVSLLAERSVLSFQLLEGHEISSYQAVQIEHLAALADVPSQRAADRVVLAGSFVNVPAIKMHRLLAVQKIAYRLAPEVLPFPHPIELGVFRRR